MKEYETHAEQPWHRYKVDVTEIVIEDGVTSIGSYAFYQFSSLKSVKIGRDVKRISEKAFGECGKLDNISVIPDGIEYIGDQAFANTSLTEISFAGTPPTTVSRADATRDGDLMASFSIGESGSTDTVTVVYPTSFSNQWILDEKGLWEGYHVSTEYVVRFDVNGGDDCSFDLSMIKAGKNLDKLPTASREGFSFVEWNEKPDRSGKAITENRLFTFC